MNRICHIPGRFCIYVISIFGILILFYQWLFPESNPHPAEHVYTASQALDILNEMESNKSWILTFSHGRFLSNSSVHHVKKKAEIREILHNASFSVQNNVFRKTKKNHTLGMINKNISSWFIVSSSSINQNSADSQPMARESVKAESFEFSTDDHREKSAPETIKDISSKSSALGLVNVVAMSLYGSELRYTAGAVRNAHLVQQNFPGWKLWVFIESPSSSKYPPVPQDVIPRLVRLGAEVHYISPEDDMIPPMMWRFLVADDAGVDWFIVRDADSRLTPRDAASVAAWMQSDRAFHCVRDHPSHAGYAVSGGLWGGRAPQLRLVLRRSWATMMHGITAGYLNDMNFLNAVIWPRVERHAYCVDSVSCDHWKNAFPFPVSRRGYEHVGQVYNEHDKPRNGDVQILKHTLENRNCVPISQSS